MGMMEKIIGIAVVILVCGVFFLGMLWLIGLTKMKKERGEVSNKKFTPNPQGSNLSTSALREISVGAILSVNNGDYLDTLATIKKDHSSTVARILKEHWGIGSPEAAENVLEQLKETGHRTEMTLFLRRAPELIEKSQSYQYKTVEEFYSVVGFDILPQEILLQYPQEINLMSQNIKTFYDMKQNFSEEDFLRQKDQFGGEESFGNCLRIWIFYTKQFSKFNEYLSMLKHTIKTLQKEGIIESTRALSSIDVSAWDFGRLVNIARYCYDCDYITEDVAWKYIKLAYLHVSEKYADWAAFSKAYVIGRALWGAGAIASIGRLAIEKCC